MKTCGFDCIPACLTCQEYDDRNTPKGKGYCTLTSLDEPVLVPEMHSCPKFVCIDSNKD